MTIQKNTILQIATTVLLVAGAVIGIVANARIAGLALLAGGLAIGQLTPSRFRRDMSLVLISVMVLVLTPVGTVLAGNKASYMAAGMIFAAALPYLVLKFWYQDEAILGYHGLFHRWKWRYLWYLAGLAMFAYFTMPGSMLQNNMYLNWEVSLQPSKLVMLFMGLMIVGIWDECFFMANILSLLKRHMPFWWANITQSAIFTSFLYEIGFRSWVLLVVLLPFTLIQGVIFNKTKSLLFIISIHLTLDLMLFFVLIHTHYPELGNIFITLQNHS